MYSYKKIRDETFTSFAALAKVDASSQDAEIFDDCSTCAKINTTCNIKSREDNPYDVSNKVRSEPSGASLTHQMTYRFLLPECAENRIRNSDMTNVRIFVCILGYSNTLDPRYNAPR